MSRDTKCIRTDVHKGSGRDSGPEQHGPTDDGVDGRNQASSLLQFIHGLEGELHVTWEEGIWAAWLYDLLKPHVHEVLVCNLRRNALLKEGSKTDEVDARQLSDLLRTGCFTSETALLDVPLLTSNEVRPHHRRLCRNRL